MEKRTRKRVRVADYEYDDDVAERTVKRVKQEKKVKKEIKQEVKTEPQHHASNNNIKAEPKIKVKSEVKVELKKEKKEKKVKIEPKLEIKPDPVISEHESSEDDTDNADADASESEAIEISSADDKSNNNDNNTGPKENFDECKTIRRGLDKKLPWPNAIEQPQAIFDNKLLEKLLIWCDAPLIMQLAQASKSVCNLVHGSHSIWQKLFRERLWRLPHEIRNKNFKFSSTEKPIPQLKISDQEVDWFSEFKRNYILCSKVRSLIKEIIALFASQEGKTFKDERLDEATLSGWEKTNSYYLSNDIREYYKVSPNPGIEMAELDELYVASSQLSLFAVFRINKTDEDEDGDPDLDSISNLLDIPKSKLTDDVAGIMSLYPMGRQGDVVWVPYLNRIYFVYPGDEVPYFTDVSSLVQKLELRIEELKVPRAMRKNRVGDIHRYT